MKQHPTKTALIIVLAAEATQAAHPNASPSCILLQEAAISHRPVDMMYRGGAPQVMVYAVRPFPTQLHSLCATLGSPQPGDSCS